MDTSITARAARAATGARIGGGRVIVLTNTRTLLCSDWVSAPDATEAD